MWFTQRLNVPGWGDRRDVIVRLRSYVGRSRRGTSPGRLRSEGARWLCWSSHGWLPARATTNKGDGGGGKINLQSQSSCSYCPWVFYYHKYHVWVCISPVHLPLSTLSPPCWLISASKVKRMLHLWEYFLIITVAFEPFHEWKWYDWKWVKQWA